MNTLFKATELAVMQEHLALLSVLFSNNGRYHPPVSYYHRDSILPVQSDCQSIFNGFNL